MKQSVELRTHRLLQVSTDLHNRMAEIRKLREMVRLAQASENDEPIHPAALQPGTNEMRV